MKKLVFVFLGLLLIGGCIPVIIGASAVTGYVLGNDSATGNVKLEYRTLWDICLERLKAIRAEVVRKDETKGVIKAKLFKDDLTLKIVGLDREVQRLKVSARRYMLPRPAVAQDVFIKIIKDLK